MILGILQARMSSSRFPGKVLKPLLGRPMLSRQIERLKQSKKMNRLMVATSLDSTDDAIELLCRDNKIDCFRGSLEDVLDRFYQAAKKHTPLHVVRLTGDCPLTDPAIIDQIIEFHLAGKFDYSSNTLEPTYPDGLDAEVLRYQCLLDAWQEAKRPSEREHVTSFIYNHPERYRLGNFKNIVDWSSLRWTVDEPVDFELVQRIYEELYPANCNFSMQDVIRLLERNPALKKINTNFQRNEGYQKSLEKDKQTAKEMPL